MWWVRVCVRFCLSNILMRANDYSRMEQEKKKGFENKNTYLYSYRRFQMFCVSDGSIRALSLSLSRALCRSVCMHTHKRLSNSKVVCYILMVEMKLLLFIFFERIPNVESGAKNCWKNIIRVWEISVSRNRLRKSFDQYEIKKANRQMLSVSNTYDARRSSLYVCVCVCFTIPCSSGLFFQIYMYVVFSWWNYLFWS